MARILIVEDEQLVAADLESKLQKLAHEVVGSVASGAEAIGMAMREHPDLVLMDIRLQGPMDGLEAARQIQAQTASKILYISAFGQLSQLKGGTLAPETCLTKPFSYSQLQAAVATRLEAK